MHYRTILCSFFFLFVFTVISIDHSMAEEKPSPGKQVAQTLQLKLKSTPDKPEESFDISFWLYLPKNYQPDGKPVPLMLFLHGAGERGKDLAVVKKHGPPMLVDKGKEFPFIIVSPQRSMTQEEEKLPYKEWKKTPWRPERLTALLDTLEKNYNVDKSRVYLTGLSMGGYGTWNLASTHPKRFAAIAPICGGGDPKKMAVLKDLPIWTFHGDKDTTVKISETEAIIKAIKAAGGDPKFTVYKGVGHHSWIKAYENSKLFEWLLEHRKK